MSLDLATAAAPLRRRTLLAYGIGDAGTGMAAALVGFYLFLFYTAVAGLPAWIAGSVMMLVRIWDVLSDQWIGWLSDRSRHPLGPRIPWMLAAALPLGLSMALLWWLPPFTGSWRLLWFVLVASLFQACYSGVNLPYSALATELTGNTSLRTRLNSLRFTGSVLASLLGLVLGARLTPDGAHGYLLMGCSAGLLLSLGSGLSAVGLAPASRACRRPQPQQASLLKQLRQLLPNRRFLQVVLLYLLIWGALQLMQPVAIIYLSDVMHLPHSWSTAVLIPFQLSALLGLWIWNSVANRSNRLLALRIGASCWIVFCLIALVLPSLDGQLPPLATANRWPLALLLTSVLSLGLSASTAYLLPWAFLPDAVDAQPHHPAGLITSFMVQIQKLGSAVSVFLLGLLLSWGGYNASLASAQPPSAILMIRLCMGLLPAVLVLLSLLVMRRWQPFSAHTPAA
ncbi:MAG: MFS transporter [Synechococcus sp.]|nr:MFS transporter [Synechococcus sp.]